jgi:hypothetical protein
VSACLGAFSSGTVFVPLAAVERSELAVAAIARALGADLARTGTSLEALAEHLGDDPWSWSAAPSRRRRHGRRSTENLVAMEPRAALRFTFV